MDAAVPAALAAIIVGIGAYALGVAALWRMPRQGHPLAFPLIATATGCLVILAGGLLWPVRVNPVLTEVPLARLLSVLGEALDSGTMVAAGAGLAGAICLGAWLAWLAFAHFNPTTELDGTPAKASGYEVVVLPLGFWLLVLAGAAVWRVTNGFTVSAFTPPVLPDPALFAVAAFPVAAFVAVHPPKQPLARTGVTVLLVLPVLAFLPFALPAAVGPDGRLAVLAVVAPVAWAVIAGSRGFNRDPRGERRLCWLVGTTALSVPLLAYLVVAARQPVALTSLLTDNGKSSAGAGLGPHLRLVLLLPLFVTFVSSKPVLSAKRSRKTSTASQRAEKPSGEQPVKKPSGERPGKLPPSRWRDFQADVLILAVRDNELGSLYLDRLRQQLAALPAEQRSRYAVALAGRLYRSYPPLEASPQLAQQDTGAAPDYPARTSVKRALDVARRLHGTNPPGPLALSRARATVAGPFEPAGEDDRDRRRALDVIETLRLALADPHDASAASPDALVTASRHEVEDAAERVINGPHAGKASDDALASARRKIGQQLASLHEPTSLDELRLMFLWPAPAMVLDDPPGTRQGAELPVQRPYRFLGIAMVIAGALAALTYLLLSRGP